MILILSKSAMSVIIPHFLQMAHSCAGKDYHEIVKCPENKVIVVLCELTSGKESVNLPQSTAVLLTLLLKFSKRLTQILINEKILLANCIIFDTQMSKQGL